jgi:hypothetical protein
MTYHESHKEDSVSPPTNGSSVEESAALVKSEPSANEEEEERIAAEMKEDDEEMAAAAAAGSRELQKSEQQAPEYLDYLRKFAPLMQQHVGGQSHQRGLLHRDHRDHLQKQPRASTSSQSQESPDRESPEEGGQTSTTTTEATPPPLTALGTPHQSLISRIYLENMMKSLRKDHKERKPASTDDSDDSCALDLSSGQIGGNIQTGRQAVVTGNGNGRLLPVSAASLIAPSVAAVPAPAASSATVSASNGKSSRRKGKAFKIERKSAATSIATADDQSSTTDSLETNSNGNSAASGLSGTHVCQYCELAFMDQIMYSIHMGYHGYQNPFKCNMCGDEMADKVSFFLHVARKSHQ